jgi:hypothetical protein
MINEENVEGIGVPLVWVIDGDCLYDLAVTEEYLSMFTEFDEVLDVSNEYPDHNGITVRFIKDGEVIEDFQTSEYFGSILLSEPQVLSLFDYPHGHFVQSPNAQFDGEKFIITNRDVTALPIWHPKNPKAPKEYFDSLN